MKSVLYSPEGQIFREVESENLTPDSNETLIKVRAVLLSPRDLIHKESDYTPGRHFIGEVVGLGNNVSRYKNGEIVSGFIKAINEDVYGAYSEYITTNPQYVVLVPLDLPLTSSVFIPLLANLINFIPINITPGCSAVVSVKYVEDIIFTQLLRISGFIKTFVLSNSPYLRTFIKPDLQTFYTDNSTTLSAMIEETKEQPEYLFDFTGDIKTIKTLIKASPEGATLVIAEKIREDEKKEILLKASDKNLKIVNGFNWQSDRISLFSIKILQTNTLELEKYITHTFRFDDHKSILEMLKKGPSLVLVEIK